MENWGFYEYIFLGVFVGPLIILSSFFFRKNKRKVFWGLLVFGILYFGVGYFFLQKFMVQESERAKILQEQDRIKQQQTTPNQ